MQQGGTASPNEQLGAATEANTYRCIALPGGGLGPLPRQTGTYERATDLEASEPDGNGYCVTGFTTVGVLSGDAGSRERIFAYEYVIGGVRKYKAEVYQEYDAGAGLVALKTITSADPSGALAYKSTTFGRTRSNRTDPFDSGPPIVVFAWYAPGGGFEKFVSAYPDPDAPAVNGVYNISTTLPADILVHQGRVVLLSLVAWDHGPDATWSTNEDMYWTAVNDVSDLSVIPAVFVPENPTGYGSWCSMSANELLLIKNAGGGLTLNGDIDDPTVVNLPNVVPTGFMGCIGTSSPIGFIYGSWQAGVWVWNGGDVSQKISNQLEDDVFTVPNADEILGQKAQFEVWHDWVLTSNNWLFDTNNGGWWRLDDPDDVRLQWFSTDDLGEELLATSLFFTNANPVHGYAYNRSAPARSYSWQSQPLWPSIGRDVDVREVTLVAHGTGTIDVTLTAYDGTPETHQVTVASNTPEMFRIAFHTRGKNIQLRLEVGDGANPAPIIYLVDIGYKPGALTPVS